MMRYRSGLPQLDGERVPHRRRDRDHADLPPRASTCRCSRRSSCSRTRRAPRRFAATTSRTSSWRASAGSASCSRARPGGRARGGRSELGYGAEELDDLNRKAIALMEELRERPRQGGAPIVISGCIGPQDDGYSPEAKLSAARGAGLPLDPDRDVRRHERRHGLRGHADLRRGGGRASRGPPARRAFRRRSRSRSRPTAGCRAGRSSGRRSSRWTPRRTAGPPTT